MSLTDQEKPVFFSDESAFNSNQSRVRSRRVGSSFIATKKVKRLRLDSFCAKTTIYAAGMVITPQLEEESIKTVKLISFVQKNLALHIRRTLLPIA